MERKSLIIGLAIGLIMGILIGGNLVYYTMVRELQDRYDDLSSNREELVSEWNDLLDKVHKLEDDYRRAKDLFDLELIPKSEFIERLRTMLEVFLLEVTGRVY